jgi:hypothetical protein
MTRIYPLGKSRRVGLGLQGGEVALGLSEVARRVAVVAGAGDEVEVEDGGVDKLCLSDSVTFVMAVLF